MDVIGQMATVALVLALLGATLWALRKRGFAGVALARKVSTRRMECLERLSLGPHQVLHLVRLGEREFLVATSPGGCTLIKSFDDRGSEAMQ
jgi:flagellar biosynthetic protein FliO